VAPPAPTRPRDRLSYATIPPSPPSKYPLTTCVISGKELATLGKKPFAIAYKGYEMQFCSEDCLDQFATDPEGYVRKMNPKAMFEHK
jgi:YHS domain-containing protein